MSVIEDLFHGRMYPAEQILPATELYQSSNSKADKLSQQLKEQLSPMQYEMFESYCTEKATIAEAMQCECFRQGMMLGARLWRELNP